MTELKVYQKISRRDYPYVVVDIVRNSPSIAVGIHGALAYVDMTVDEALEFVRTNHTDSTITGVTNYV